MVRLPITGMALNATNAIERSKRKEVKKKDTGREYDSLKLIHGEYL